MSRLSTQRMPSEDAPSDAELVARVRDGDPSAFDVLVRRHINRALTVAHALSGSRADAEDVVQDAFISALESIDDCLEPAKFAQWLVAIVRNRAHNTRAYREVRRTEPLDDLPVAATGADPAMNAERADIRRHLLAGLAALTPSQREVVVMHDLQGWKHREIAERLGISEVMSRQHLFVARRALRAHIGSRVYSELRHD